MTSGAARLVVPALRWDRAHRFSYLEGLIDDALELGVGGFLVDGGPREEAAALIARLRAASRGPILVAAHAERGAGGAFDGLLALPPLGALASAGVVVPEGTTQPALNPEPVRRAARLTARELRNAGATWALAPVCDLDLARGSALVGSRAAGDDPAVVAAIVGEWVDACQAEAVVATAMQFPGVGRETPDGVVADPTHALRGADLTPFAAAIESGVACVMVARARVPGLGAAEGALRSAALIENLLRTELHFDGFVSTPPLDREAGLATRDEAALAVEAVAAGCDVVLAPGDLHGVVEALDRAVAGGAVRAPRLRAAVDRVERWASWAQQGAAREPSLDDVMWARRVADAGVAFVRGARPRIGATLEVVAVADGTAATDWFTDTMRAQHIAVTERREPSPGDRSPLVVAWVPAGGLTGDVARAALDQVRAIAGPPAAAGRDVAVVAFAHPRAAAALGGAFAVLCAWDATQPMQEAAARALVTVR
jgi:beta-glucosidase-like glycosyl hydrolase